MPSFTTHDRPINIGGTTYQPDESISPSAIQKTSSLDIDNVELRGVQGTISGDAVITGGLIGKTITVLKGVNWRNPPAAIANHPAALKQIGVVGDVKVEGETTWTIQHQSELQRKLNQSNIKVTSPLCQHIFCDNGCGLNIANYTVTTVIAGVVNQTNFSLVGTTNNFSYGSITFVDGPNAGLSFGITEGSGGVIYLAEIPEGIVANGQAVIAKQGCAYTESDCKNRYNNYRQFLGVPPRGNWMPGNEFYQNPQITR